jgi:hypothetical protein
MIFLFSKILSLTLGPKEPPIQWLFPWKYSGCGVIQNSHIRLEPTLGRSGGKPLLPDIFMASTGTNWPSHLTLNNILSNSWPWWLFSFLNVITHCWIHINYANKSIYEHMPDSLSTTPNVTLFKTALLSPAVEAFISSSSACVPST